MNKPVYIVICVVFAVFLNSCAPKRNLSYFTNLQNNSIVQTQSIEPVIQPDDILGITVNTLSPETNSLFTGGAVTIASPATDAGSSGVVNEGISNNGYSVDKNGMINFPVIGKVKLGGLTINAATDTLTKRVSQSVKNPIVNIKFNNFRVTILGEVNRPGTYVSQSRKINLLEAIGMAGDITTFGKREHILLMRDSLNNQKKMVHLNLQQKETISSPYFFLKQNDVIYVEPDPVRESQTNTNYRTISLTLAATSIIVVILSRVL